LHRAAQHVHGLCAVRLVRLAHPADGAARSDRCCLRFPPAPRPTRSARLKRTSHREITTIQPDQRRPAMEVILLERVGRLGHMGDVVQVKDGFGRNCLLPKAKAVRASKENKVKYEGMKDEFAQRNIEMRGEAQKIGGGLDGKKFVVLRQPSEVGELYGS